jgi:hypothetical protein
VIQATTAQQALQRKKQHDSGKIWEEQRETRANPATTRAAWQETFFPGTVDELAQASENVVAQHTFHTHA